MTFITSSKKIIKPAMTSQLTEAFDAFDAYNSKDPNIVVYNGKEYPREVLYAMRMTDRLNVFAPDAAEHVKLAARCQHIGRWEIARTQYAMDRKGYLQWRNAEKQHHADIATKILKKCGYDEHTIEAVSFLLLKKQLQSNPDTKLLEDVICLVFVEFYLSDFATKHEDEKLLNILQKTLKKMSPRAIADATKLVPEKLKELVNTAVKGM
jgi:hypothetical protein